MPSAPAPSSAHGRPPLKRAGSHPVGAHLATLGKGPGWSPSVDCTDPAYRGWRWSVTVARVPRGRTVTIDEVVLVSGEDSVVAPEWVPFDARITPEDLGAGDVIPSDPLDDRLVPSHVHADIVDPHQPLPAFWEGRPGAPAGALPARARRHRGPLVLQPRPRHPDGQAVRQRVRNVRLPAGHRRCAGGAFGVCANEQAPSDGRVVALDYGCGAHSENIVLRSFDRGEVVVDELRYEPIELVADLPETADQANDSDAEQAPDTPRRTPVKRLVAIGLAGTAAATVLVGCEKPNPV